MNKEKMNYEQRLLHLTVASGILFSVIEVMMAIYTNSQAVLMDSIYDGAEAVVLALMVFFVPLFYRPCMDMLNWNRSFCWQRAVFLRPLLSA